MGMLPPDQLDGSQPFLTQLFWSDLPEYNITLSTQGITETIYKYHRSPVIDLGTVDLIRKGEIDIVNFEIAEIDGQTVKFADGSTRDFDYILLATGYTSGQGPHTNFLEKKITDKLLNEYKVINSGVEPPAQERLYFVGHNDYLGRLMEINLETSTIVSDLIAKK